MQDTELKETNELPVRSKTVSQGVSGSSDSISLESEIACINLYEKREEEAGVRLTPASRSSASCSNVEVIFVSNGVGTLAPLLVTCKEVYISLFSMEVAEVITFHRAQIGD